MKILITGASGQLGQSFRSVAKDLKHDIVFTDVNDLDITNYLELKNSLKDIRPEIIINCAAYTNVEGAEVYRDSAHKINSIAPAYLAEWAGVYAVKLIHISTDFIFSGRRRKPYIETDRANPINFYGETKHLGEKKLLESKADVLILRTSWLFSEYGNNFVKTIYQLAQQKSELKVVNDQFGSPTYTIDLVMSIINIINNDKLNDNAKIIHFCNDGIVSWFDIANEIVKTCGFRCKIKPVTTEEYGARVQRPAYSALDNSKIRKEYGIKIRGWKEALHECILRLETRS